ncbi:Protein LTO1 homolog [Geodia barretti]|uniref:Protein LTO1 homolog n=1 Tax=Geodia barretti TaxID=519541 RepID=A0AA35U2S4_GEOBA|nr:Protein LTO1 homolog [Geodia barretti]
MDEDDPFESLLFIEDRLQEQGYGEGRGHGVAEGLKEAAEAGKANGVDVGWEVGYYLGFAETWLRLLKTKPLEHEEKKIRVLSTLVEMLRSFRILDVESTEFRRELSQLQAKYKQTLALLKVPLAAVKAKADLSF